MTDFERRIERRVVERCPVDEAAQIRPVAARNQPRPPAFPVTIVDVSVKGAGLRTTDAIELRPGWAVELGIGGAWSRCRVAWSRRDRDGSQLAGVEFTARIPAFLPALLEWLDARDRAGSA